MSEVNQSVIDQSPAIMQRIDSLVNRFRGVTALMATGLALGAVGTAVEASVDVDAAAAHAAGKPKLIQQYVKVEASDAGGDPLPGVQKNTFVFREQCEAGSKKVSRTVTYNQSNQPLGSCNAGSKVVIIEKEPLQGSWLHQKGVKQTVRKATGKNNHFSFVEQAIGTSVEPHPYSPAPAPAPAPNPAPQPPGGGEPEDPYAPGNVGVDISWPQCGTPDETPSGADFGIVGVNAGLGYSTNPCLAEEAANFPGKQLNLYVNTGWNSSSVHINPDSPRQCGTGDENCLAYNYGYNAGLYAAVNAAASEGITSATWWVDVESDATWSNDTTQNRNSLQGEHDALIDSGATTVGAYSTTVQWGDITGAWKNNWPSWGSTTWETAAEAQTYCEGHEFTGGPSKMMQFLPPGEIDHNVAC